MKYYYNMDKKECNMNGENLPLLEDEVLINNLKQALNKLNECLKEARESGLYVGMSYVSNSNNYEIQTIRRTINYVNHE